MRRQLHAYVKDGGVGLHEYVIEAEKRPEVTAADSPQLPLER
ncbi:MAG: hypothetical protein WDO18_05425 [Acidobacteriota bacterium]